MTVLRRDAALVGRPGLLAGDVVALVAFAVLGRRSHDEASGWDAVVAVAETALPFVLGWVVAASLLGAFGAERTASPRTVVRSTALAWLGAFPLAVLGRALILGRFSPWTFYVVAFSVALLFVLGWRLAFVLASRRFGGR